MSKLNDLCAIEGINLANDDQMMGIILDSIQPAICTTPHCSYTEGMEPDQDAGWCPECEKGTLASISILMGII